MNTQNLNNIQLCKIKFHLNFREEKNFPMLMWNYHTKWSQLMKVVMREDSPDGRDHLTKMRKELPDPITMDFVLSSTDTTRAEPHYLNNLVNVAPLFNLAHRDLQVFILNNLQLYPQVIQEKDSSNHDHVNGGDA